MGLELRRRRRNSGRGLMLPVIVQFIVVMLAHALDERMAPTRSSPRDLCLDKGSDDTEVDELVDGVSFHRSHRTPPSKPEQDHQVAARLVGLERSFAS